MEKSQNKVSLGAADDVLASFVVLATYLGVLADPDQIHHDRGLGDQPYSFDDLLRIARKTGLVARRRSVAASDLPKVPLPALVAMRGGGAAILLKAESSDDDGLRYLVLVPGAPRPEIYSEARAEAEFAFAAEGVDLLLMTTRERISGSKRPFDISWFIPALVKYRKPLRDVLVASFFLQLFGLVSPIFSSS